MQEHVEQREDGEVKRPRFHLKFAYRLKVHGVSDFQFVCLLEFCSVAACCLAPSIAGGGNPFRCCSNECRGDVVSLLLYRGRLPVGATVTSAPPLQLWFFEQTRFLAGSGRNSMRWQRCLMEEAGG